uniref:Uncharacterized protein n=1 Tax=Rhizophora mucronata TaxID=61149 RepID=A0A2P2NTR7_RHIMU
MHKSLSITVTVALHLISRNQSNACRLPVEQQ